MLAVPYNEDLTVAKMREFASRYEQCKAYLPDNEDGYALPRPWLANVLSTVIGEDFDKWVRERIETHNAERKMNQNIEVEMVPEVLEAFNAS